MKQKLKTKTNLQKKNQISKLNITQIPKLNITQIPKLNITQIPNFSKEIIF